MESQIVLSFTTGNFIGLITIFLIFIVILIVACIIFMTSNNNVKEEINRLSSNVYDIKYKLDPLEKINNHLYKISCENELYRNSIIGIDNSLKILIDRNFPDKEDTNKKEIKKGGDTT